ncbi:MAG: class I SAM-dependent methyltransferase [Bacteroidetes bacterium]|jgi:SAM-dependent methyltransferase|nr:class I SAM-dependent methyltransferase [Bacteroidota bacterium]
MAARESRREHWETFWEDKQEVGEVYSNAGRVLEHLGRVIDLHGKRVLEIGAGTGRDSFPLVAAGAAVTQLDYAENSLRLLKRVSEQDGVPVRIVGGDTFALPFRDGTFDVVFHQGLLEHFRKPVARRLLEENVRVLRPGGLLLVDVPQRYHAYTLVKHVLIALDKWFAGWERSFSIGELTRALRSLGLEPVHRYGVWMYPSFFYRATREVLKKAGIRLPLYPRIPVLHALRASIRKPLLTTLLPLHTGLSIGVIARKG